jgi:hypothetical protein
MQFDDRNDHQAKLAFLVKGLEECMEHQDLLGVERTCLDIHLYLRECAVRGKYSFIGTTMESIANLLTLRESLPAKLLILEEFPVSLKAYIDISRSGDDAGLQLALVKNIIEHQSLISYRYDHFDNIMTQWGRVFSKKGNEEALITLLDYALDANQDVVQILFMSALRDMKHHSESIASWARVNFEIITQPVGVPREYRPNFREWVDFRSFGCPVSDKRLRHEPVGNLDLLYYLKKLKQPVPEEILDDIRHSKKLDASAKLAAYSIVSGAHPEFVPTQPNMQSLEVIIEALRHCASAVERDLLDLTDELTDRVAKHLDQIVADLDPRYVQKLVTSLPSEWVVKSELCRSVALEIDLGL